MAAVPLSSTVIDVICAASSEASSVRRAALPPALRCHPSFSQLSTTPCHLDRRLDHHSAALRGSPSNPGTGLRGSVRTFCTNGAPACGFGPWDLGSVLEANGTALLPNQESSGTALDEDDALLLDTGSPYSDSYSDADVDIPSTRLSSAPESRQEIAEAAARAVARRSMKEGLMPPWNQEGLMQDVAGLSVDTLVSADAVYNKELRYWPDCCSGIRIACHCNCQSSTFMTSLCCFSFSCAFGPPQVKQKTVPPLHVGIAEIARISVEMC